MLADISAQIETIQAQLRSPHPARRIVYATLRVLLALILGIAGNGVWANHGERLTELVNELVS